MGIGRLKNGVSSAQARAEMSRIATELAREIPEDNRRHGLGVEPAAALPVDGRSPISRYLALVAALTGLVLLVACTSVGGMVLARGINRAREMSLRLALGADRRPPDTVAHCRERRDRRWLGRQSACWWRGGALSLLGQLVPMFGLEVTYDVSVDWRVTAFSIVVAVLTVIVCGLLPAAAGDARSILRRR